MQFLAHRGLWKNSAEKNSSAGLRQALEEGFGVETDFRDAAKQLVIAHDPAGSDAMSTSEFFQLYQNGNHSAPLALNIKADGLRDLLKTLLRHHGIKNYFCFDMSVPETLCYQREGLRFFTRVSEIETVPVLYAEAAGVWLDMFRSDWVQPADIEKHLAAGKQAALVSPELHQRPHLDFWSRLRSSGLHTNPNLLLCTDHPAVAREFFRD